MSYFNFNDAPQQTGGDLIPAKTLAKVVCTIRPGGEGEQGWVSRSNSGFEYLQLELAISSSPYMRKRIFQNAGIGGTTDGHKKAAEISRSMFRAILESARGIDPKDESEAARNARHVTGAGDFNGIEFAIEIGIEKDKTGQYSDKNKIQRVITPDHKEYRRIMDGETILPAGVKNPTADAAPAWQAPAAPAGNPVPGWAT